MSGHPKMQFFPLCDLQPSQMRRDTIEGSASFETQSLLFRRNGPIHKMYE